MSLHTVPRFTESVYEPTPEPKRDYWPAGVMLGCALLYGASLWFAYGIGWGNGAAVTQRKIETRFEQAQKNGKIFKVGKLTVAPVSWGNNGLQIMVVGKETK